jgi:putative ABC transport system permease protein
MRWDRLSILRIGMRILPYKGDVISLARLTLRREWYRFLPAVFAVGFSGLLILVQLSILLGIFRTVSVYIDESSADLWIGFPDTPSVDLARMIPTRNEVFLRQHPEVLAVEKFSFGAADIRRKDGSAATGILLGVDTRTDGMGFSKKLTPELREYLNQPDSILLDISSLENLQAAVGDDLEINKKRVKVVGVVSGIAAIGGPNVLTSTRTARYLDNSLRDENDTAFLLARLRHPSRAAQVRAELMPQGSVRPYSVWQADDFSAQSQRYWLLETGMGIGFVFSGGIALVIGLVITSQTLKAVVISSLREYATLRALGVNFSELRRVVLEQAWWVGLAGALLTTVVTRGLVVLAESKHVLIYAPLSAYLGTAAFIVGIALTSGWLAVRTLKKSDPATLLR